MSDEIIIRVAKLSDIPQIYDIEVRSFKSPYPISLLTSLLIIAQDLFLVAELKSKIVGYVIALLRGKRMGHIVSIAVHPEYRGRGLGKILLREILKKLRSKGAIFVRLEVRVSNKVAISLYEKMGFWKVYEIPRYYQDGESCYVMVKIL